MQKEETIQLEISTLKGYIYLEKITCESKAILHQKITDLLCNKLKIDALNLNHLESGQPYIENIPQLNISISHTKTWIGIYISENYAVGLNILENNIFMNLDEKPFLNSREMELHNTNKTAVQGIILGAKKAIYKYFAGEITSFKKQICVEKIDFEEKKIHANTIYGRCECTFELFEKDFCLVYI